VQHFRAQLVFPTAAAVRQPLATQVANLARATKARQLIQGSFQNRFIARTIVWRTEGASHRMIHEGGARRGDSAHDVVHGADDQSGDAARFDDVGDETDGLMTEGSVGNQQREIHPRASEFLRDRRRKLSFNFLVFPHSAHERIMRRSELPDNAALH